MSNIADNPFAPNTNIQTETPVNAMIQNNPFVQADIDPNITNTPQMSPINTIGGPETVIQPQPSPQYPDGSVNIQNQSFPQQSDNTGIMPAGGQMNTPQFDNQGFTPNPNFAAPNPGFAAPNMAPNPGFAAPNPGFAAPNMAPNPGFAAPNQGFAAPNPNPGFAAPNMAPNQGFAAPNMAPNQGFAAPNMAPNQGFAAPNQGFAQAPAAPAVHGQGTEAPKYSIIDMFWLINRKVFRNEPFMDGECSFLTIGFNANFNNMRLTFHVLNQQDLQGTSLIMQNMRKVTTINLYSETAGELFFNKGNGNPVRLYERVIRPGNWSPNLSQITWLNDKIVIQTQDSQGTLSCFTLLDWHLQAFESALNFMVDGNAWKACLNNI